MRNINWEMKVQHFDNYNQLSLQSIHFRWLLLRKFERCPHFYALTWETKGNQRATLFPVANGLLRLNSDIIKSESIKIMLSRALVYLFRIPRFSHIHHLIDCKMYEWRHWLRALTYKTHFIVLMRQLRQSEGTPHFDITVWSNIVTSNQWRAMFAIAHSSYPLFTRRQSSRLIQYDSVESSVRHRPDVQVFVMWRCCYD